MSYFVPASAKPVTINAGKLKVHIIKHLQLTVLFLCLAVNAFAQPAVNWAAKTGGAGNDVGLGVGHDSQGNVYVTGYFTGTVTYGSTTLTSSGSNDIFLLKYDANGSIVWAKKAGGSADDQGLGLCVDINGNVIISGIVASANAQFGGTTIATAGSYDAFVAKYDTDGNFLWVNRGGGTNQDYGWNVGCDNSGNVYVGGSILSISATFGTTTLTTSGSYDVFVAKYDAGGNFIQVKSAGGVGEDIAYSIAVHPDGICLYVTGRFASTATFGSQTVTSSGGNDIFVAGFDFDTGTWKWARKAGGTGSDTGQGAATDDSCNVYITGQFSSTTINFSGSTLTNSGSSDIFIAKYNEQGDLKWVKKAGGTGADYGSGIGVDAARNIYVTGYISGTASFGTTSLTSNGGLDIFAARYTADATLDYAVSYGGTGSEYGRVISSDNQGNAYITGPFQNTVNFGGTSLTSTGGQDVFVMKISAPVQTINAFDASLKAELSHLLPYTIVANYLLAQTPVDVKGFVAVKNAIDTSLITILDSTETSQQNTDSALIRVATLQNLMSTTAPRATYTHIDNTTVLNSGGLYQINDTLITGPITINGDSTSYVTLHFTNNVVFKDGFYINDIGAKSNVIIHANDSVYLDTGSLNYRTVIIARNIMFNNAQSISNLYANNTITLKKSFRIPDEIFNHCGPHSCLEDRVFDQFDAGGATGCSNCFSPGGTMGPTPAFYIDCWNNVRIQLDPTTNGVSMSTPDIVTRSTSGFTNSLQLQCSQRIELGTYTGPYYEGVIKAVNTDYTKKYILKFYCAYNTIDPSGAANNTTGNPPKTLHFSFHNNSDGMLPNTSVNDIAFNTANLNLGWNYFEKCITVSQVNNYMQITAETPCNGCTVLNDFDNILIAGIKLVEVNYEAPDISVCCTHNGACPSNCVAQVNPTCYSPTADFNYSWTPGTGLSSTTDIAPSVCLPQGSSSSYQITVSPKNGLSCSVTKDFNVIIHANPSVIIDGPDKICSDGSNTALLTATSPGTITGYTWTANGTVVGTTASITVQPTVATNYTVTVYDAFCGTATATHTITLGPPSGGISNNANASICPDYHGLVNTSVNITAIGGQSYSWYPSFGIDNGATSSVVTVSPDITTQYTVNITNTSGCVKKDFATVTVYPANQVTYAGNPQATVYMCNGNPVTLTASTTLASTYQWGTPTGSLAGQTANTLTVNQPGTYSYIATDANGCQTIADYITVVAASSTVPQINGPVSACEATATYTITPAYAAGTATFTWNVVSGAGATLATGNGASVTVNWLPAGTYSNTGGTVKLTVHELSPCPKTTVLSYPVAPCCGCPDNAQPAPRVTQPCTTATVLYNGYISSLPAGTANGSNVVQQGSGTTITGGDYVINGILYLDKNTDLKGAHFYMAPDAKIWITQNSQTFTLEDNAGTPTIIEAHKTCGNKMWDHIQNKGSNAANVYAKNGVVIMDADTAIISNEGNIVVDINNTSFTNNYVGIYINNYTPHTIDIKNTTFNASGNLLNSTSAAQHKTRFGFIGLNVNNTFIYSLSPPAGNPNTFSKLAYGVYSNSSGAFIQNNRFINMQELPQCAVDIVGHRPCRSFIYLYGRGIYATASLTAPYHSLLAGGTNNNQVNLFENCPVGIEVANYTDAAITKNNFTTTGNFKNWRKGISITNCGTRSIQVSQNTMALSGNPGIEFYNNPGAILQIDNNTVTYPGTLTSAVKATGISISEPVTVSSAAKATVEFNTINNPKLGIHLQNIKAGVSQPNDVSIQFNTVNNVYRDATTGHTAGINCINSRGLVSANTISGAAAASLNKDYNGIYNESCTGGHLVTCNSISNCSRGITFKNISTNAQVLGNSITNYYYGLLLQNDPAFAITQGDATTQSNNEWTGSFYYNAGGVKDARVFMMNSPNAQQTSSLIKFYVKPSPTKYNLVIGTTIFRINNASAFPIIDNANNTNIDPCGGGNQNFLASIPPQGGNALRDWLLERLAFLTQQSNAGGKLILTSAMLAEITAQQLNDTDATQWQSTMDNAVTLQSGTLYEHYQYNTFNYATLLERTAQPLSESVLNDLITIAESCVEVAGPAVYEAQAMLLYRGIEFEQGNCANANRIINESGELTNNDDVKQEDVALIEKDKTTITGSKTEIYPNPFNNQLSVKGIKQNSTLEIYNASGQLMLSQQLKDSFTTTLETKQWTEGVYLLVLKDENNATYYQSKVLKK